MTDFAYCWNILDSQLKRNVYAHDITVGCCNKPNIVEDFATGSYVCTMCGVVQSMGLIDTNPEWRDFNNETNGFSNETKNRCGMPTNPLFTNESLGTMISGGSFMARMNNWGKMSYEDRALLDLKKDITTRVQEYNIPKAIIDEVLIVYKNISKDEIHRGKVKEGLIANCFYYTFKKSGINYSLKEISEMLKLDINDMLRCRKKYFDIMNLGSEIMTADNFIDRFCEKLNIPQNIINLCNKIYLECEQLNLLTGSSPQSISSGIIYFVSEELKLSIHKTDISDTCGVRDVTTVKIYKKILEQKKIIYSNIKNKK
jgi:transcription initiation factor TFIIB